MKFSPHSTTALVAGLLSLAPSASAHSWIEYAKKLAKNGTMIGATGYPRGYVPRNSTDPVYTDTIPQNILPVSGQSAYSGNEIINKYKYDASPEYPMLEASAGDYVAIMHLENGHTTLPENQPLKPKNRGTIYFYGTSKPADEEKLFDIHLLWNKNGTGGDGRGTLLATRNYDDGQCYQTNGGEISTTRATDLADKGAKHEEELACQSDIKLPDDLAEGSVYTIYWYWDWPDLNSAAIDIASTTNGEYPWAGTFMRGDKDPNGYTMAAIAKNESYSSVIDIKITGTSAQSFTAKQVALDYIQDQDIYNAGIEAQMKSNFQVEVGEGGGSGSGGGGGSSTIGTPTATATSALTSAPVVSTPGSGGGSSGGGSGVSTVTVTETVRPPASVTTVYVTVPAEGAAETPQSTSTTTKTVMVTRSTTASDAAQATESPTSTYFLTLTTHINGKSSTAESTSTAYLTLTTHINGQEPAQQPTSTVVKTLTTHINSNPDSTQASIPGGSFRETSASVGSSATSDAAITPTPFLRRRGNWALGNF